MVYVAIFGKLVVLSAALVGLNMVDFAAYDLAFFGYFFQVVFTLAQLAIIATAFMDLPFEEYWNGLLVGFAVMAAALFLVLSVIDANTRGYADPATGNGVVAAELQRLDEMKAAAKNPTVAAAPARRWDVAAPDEASWQPPPPPPPAPEGGPGHEGAGGAVDPVVPANP